MKVNVRYATIDVPVKTLDNETIERIEKAPFAMYNEQLLAQEKRHMNAKEVHIVTAYERDLLLHLKAAFVYFQHYRAFDGLMAQSFCGSLTQYEQVTEETVLKKVYYVTIRAILFEHTAQKIALSEGQFLRCYRDEDQWIYVIMENV